MNVGNQKYAGYSHGGRSEKSNNFCVNYAFILTAAACLAGSAGSTTLMLGITAMFAPLILNPKYLLGPVLFFTIFDDFLLLASNASASRFITIFFIVGVVISVLRKGTVKKESFYFVLLIFLGVILSLYSTQGYSSLPISYSLNVILAIAMINLSETTPEEIPKRLYSYAVLALVYVYFLLVKNGFGALVDGSRMSIAENVNSNQLAMGLAIVMALLVSDLLLFKEHIVQDVFMIGANCVALFLSGSRTALIAAIVAAFLLYIINAQDRRSRRRAFILLICSFAILAVIYSNLQRFFPVIMKRFTVDSVKNSGGSGRMDIWVNYFVYFFPEHWLIGMGFDPLNLYYGLENFNGKGHGAHNLIVEILSKSGMIGMALYTACFARFFGAALKRLRTNRSLLLPIAIVLTILINGIGEDVLLTRFLWFGIGLGYVLLYTTNKQD